MNPELETAPVDPVSRLLKWRTSRVSKVGTPCANCATQLEGPYCHSCGNRDPQAALHSSRRAFPLWIHGLFAISAGGSPDPLARFQVRDSFPPNLPSACPARSATLQEGARALAAFGTGARASDAMRGFFHQAMIEFAAGDMIHESLGLRHRAGRAGHDLAGYFV